MLATLGFFVFELRTVPFGKLRRRQSWRQQQVQGASGLPVHQFAGKNADSITLTGVLYPEVTGGPVTLAMVEAMANSGKAWLLIGGDGAMYGAFVIKRITTTKSVFFANGAARKIEFELNLERTYNEQIDTLGNLAQFAGPALQSAGRLSQSILGTTPLDTVDTISRTAGDGFGAVSRLGG